MRNKIRGAGLALLTAGALAVGGGIASAAVTFDATSGRGFVGKGDVQTALGWNNQALQQNANSVTFQSNSTTVTEVSWECTNTNNEHTQQRARTTTTSTQGVVSAVTRDNKTGQVTGFDLTGYSGIPTTSSTTDGPPVDSCPAPASSWTLATPAGEPQPVSSSSSLEVSTDGTTWKPIG